MTEPDTIHDEVLGELAYDEPMEEWYAAMIIAPNQRIEITVWWRESKDGPFGPILARAREAFIRFRERESEYRKALAADMIERYQVSARVQRVLPDATTLAGELTPKGLSINTDGSATVHYDDATELFADHSIMVDLNADGSFDGFTLQG